MFLCTACFFICCRVSLAFVVAKTMYCLKEIRVTTYSALQSPTSRVQLGDLTLGESSLSCCSKRNEITSLDLLHWLCLLRYAFCRGETKKARRKTHSDAVFLTEAKKGARNTPFRCYDQLGAFLLFKNGAQIATIFKSLLRTGKKKSRGSAQPLLTGKRWQTTLLQRPPHNRHCFLGSLYSGFTVALLPFGRFEMHSLSQQHLCCAQLGCLKYSLDISSRRWIQEVE